MAKVLILIFMHKQGTSRNKTSLNRTCFAHNLSTASM